jgi:hypothetical protein
MSLPSLSQKTKSTTDDENEKQNKTSQRSHTYIHMKKCLNGKRARRNEEPCIRVKKCLTLLLSSIPLYERGILSGIRVRQKRTKHPRVS